MNGGAGTPFDGYNNTVFGDSALLNGTIGNYNIAIGEVAQGGLQSGSFNISMGLYALGGYPPPFSGATSGSYNTAIGNYAMENIGQGSYNVALGEAALRGYTARTGSASYNVAIGASASLSASSAVNNVTIGYQAGSKITTGSWNTLVGAYTGSEFMNNNIILSDGLGDVKFWYNSGSNGIIQLRDDTQITGSLNVTGSVNVIGGITGSISATNGVISGSSQLTTSFPLKTVGTWTVPTGASTQSFTVEANSSYTMWVNGNIPNGIITWNATATLSNTNVPVVGAQYGWYYVTGNALVLTSMPNQFAGISGSILTTPSDYAPNTSNVFNFGITNNSGTSQTINYGYIKLS